MQARVITPEADATPIQGGVLDDRAALDTNVVPGGCCLRRPKVCALAGAWLRGRQGSTRRFASVCTGAYGFAASGMLDGCRASQPLASRRRRRASVSGGRLRPGRALHQLRRLLHVAGITAGVDLALALIEEDFAAPLSLAAARQMVVDMKRSGGQLQYSEPLQFQVRGGDRFAELTARLPGDPDADWSVETMAAVAGLSPRQFGRRFKVAFATTPGRMSTPCDWTKRGRVSPRAVTAWRAYEIFKKRGLA